MNRAAIDWTDGDESIRREVEVRTTRGPFESSESLQVSAHRSLYRVATPTRDVVLKIHRTHLGRHRGREFVKRVIGTSPAQREWQALIRLYDAGVPVPEPLARGRLQCGSDLLVMPYLDGRDLRSHAEGATTKQRLQWIDRIAEAVAILHAAGFRHGDLHLGNLYAHHDRVLILDLQRARPARTKREQLRDLAHLDFSIARRGWGSECRKHLRRALGSPPGLDAASLAFVRDFLRGRSRRQLNVGGSGTWDIWRPVSVLSNRPPDKPLSELPESLSHMHPSTLLDTKLDAPSIRSRDFHGFRVRGEDSLDLDRVLIDELDDPRPGDRRDGRTRITVHQTDASSIVVKRTTSHTHRGRLANRFRSSAALRSFRIGQRLELLGRLGAPSLGALEERAAKRLVTDWLFMENVGQSDLDIYRPATEDEAHRCAISLADWIADWHAWGIDHRDLKAGNIRIDDRHGDYRFWLIDLGDVRFRRRPNDASRRRALVQLNASLSDQAFSPSARSAALDAYLARLPFRGVSKSALIDRIVRESLARDHRWRGDRCPSGTHRAR